MNAGSFRMCALRTVRHIIKSLLCTLLMLLPVVAHAQQDSTTNKKGETVGLKNPLETGNDALVNAPKSKRADKIDDSQKGYFYAAFKLSVEDLATYAFADEAEAQDYETKEGLILDFGYGKQINKLMGIEAGLGAYFLNPLNLFYDHEEDEGYDALDIQSRAFSLQVRPFLTFDVGAGASLKLGAGLLYQQLHSSGKYYPDQGQDNTSTASGQSKSSYRSRFFLNYEPFTGLDFKISDKWAVGLNLTYVRINWNRSLHGLRFSNQPGLQLPEHRTSMVFLGAKVAFK
ncbi:outer membrane beta-barrel protein [Pedobacter sp. SAFR-022]|uniref:outer membrane beta-barrel protein n=1 Tax=Pedobacter sp. SAFR-022 TaxID=3436861 RepID=UPI003F7DA3C9